MTNLVELFLLLRTPERCVECQKCVDCMAGGCIAPSQVTLFSAIGTRIVHMHVQEGASDPIPEQALHEAVKEAVGMVGDMANMDLLVGNTVEVLREKGLWPHER